MIIDLQRTVIRKKLTSLFTAIAFVVVIVVVLVTYVFPEEIYTIDKYEFAISLAILYFIYVVITSIRQYGYIYFSDEGNKVVLRYFSMGLFEHKKSSIEIPKKDFAGYEIEKSFFYLKERLILFQKTTKGVAKYPAVSITALSREERKKIVSAMNQIKK